MARGLAHMKKLQEDERQKPSPEVGSLRSLHGCAAREEVRWQTARTGGASFASASTKRQSLPHRAKFRLIVQSSGFRIKRTSCSHAMACHGHRKPLNEGDSWLHAAWGTVAAVMLKGLPDTSKGIRKGINTAGCMLASRDLNRNQSHKIDCHPGALWRESLSFRPR